MQFVLMDHVQ